MRKGICSRPAFGTYCNTSLYENVIIITVAKIVSINNVYVLLLSKGIKASERNEKFIYFQQLKVNHQIFLQWLLEKCKFVWLETHIQDIKKYVIFSISVILLVCIMALALEQAQAQYLSYYYPYYGNYYGGYYYGKRAVGNYERPNAYPATDRQGNDIRIQPYANNAGGNYYQETSNNNRAYP